jgi:hypothetical protein
MGGQARDDIRLVLREAMILASIWLAAGLYLQLIATRVLRAYNSARDHLLPADTYATVLGRRR